MDDHTQYTSRAVRTLLDMNDEYHLVDGGCLDAPEDVPSGAHRGLDNTDLGRIVYAWSVSRR